MLSVKCYFLQWEFQFHKGTIKTSFTFPFPTALPDFNSIKVRLKQEYQYFYELTDIFQFHKGTIKTVWRKSEIQIFCGISIP